MHRHLRFLSALILVITLNSCANGPPILVSDAQMQQASLKSWTDIKSKEKISTNPDEHERANRIAQRIIAIAPELQGYPWEVQVFDSKEVNAFALPGGKIGVYNGLMKVAATDDELAAVIGHEISHVTARHSAKRVSGSMLASIGTQIADLGLAAAGYSGAGQLLGAGVQYGLLMPYSRKQEYEADAIGLHYMTRAGYDPNAAITFWRKMQQQSGGKAPPEFASTHPADANRIAALEKIIRAQAGAADSAK